MILTRKQALEKLQFCLEEESEAVLIARLMGFYKNMSDEMLKTALEIEWDTFIIIDTEPKKD